MLNIDMDHYNTPKAKLEEPTVFHGADANLLPRFLAGVLDIVLLLLVDGAVLAWLSALYGETFLKLLYSDTTLRYTAYDPLLVIFTLAAIGLSLGVIIYCMLNYLLLLNGQTIGKRLFGLKIVGLQGELLPWHEIVIKRFLPFWACLGVPYVGSILLIIDLLPCLSKKRRCLHDMIAKTRVITVKT